MISTQFMGPMYLAGSQPGVRTFINEIHTQFMGLMYPGMQEPLFDSSLESADPGGPGMFLMNMTGPAGRSQW
ncbi:hypothetical protein M0804_008222 [Polistes exclamans]|nr:hypothetical protein M0804_008222 [Polistes exclamans]